MTRPSNDQYFLEMASLASTKSTCVRRQVGCVLVNSLNHVLATGYNGVPSKFDHCFDEPCEGAKSKPGEGLDLCLAVHAEANALLQCRDVQQIDTVYCTDSPCIHCVKMLLNTSAWRIVFSRPYPHAASQELWTRHGNRFWQPGA